MACLPLSVLLHCTTLTFLLPKPKLPQTTSHRLYSLPTRPCVSKPKTSTSDMGGNTTDSTRHQVPKCILLVFSSFHLKNVKHCHIHSIHKSKLWTLVHSLYQVFTFYPAPNMHGRNEAVETNFTRTHILLNNFSKKFLTQLSHRKGIWPVKICYRYLSAKVLFSKHSHRKLRRFIWKKADK